MTILYRTDSSMNMRRFYRLDIQTDLFGQWIMTREWGRIGHRGQIKTESFHSEVEAAKALQIQYRKKAKRGYMEATV